MVLFSHCMVEPSNTMFPSFFLFLRWWLQDVSIVNSRDDDIPWTRWWFFFRIAWLNRLTRCFFFFPFLSMMIAESKYCQFSRLRCFMNEMMVLFPHCMVDAGYSMGSHLWQLRIPQFDGFDESLIPINASAAAHLATAMAFVKGSARIISDLQYSNLTHSSPKISLATPKILCEYGG